MLLLLLLLILSLVPLLLFLFPCLPMSGHFPLIIKLLSLASLGAKVNLESFRQTDWPCFLLSFLSFFLFLWPFQHSAAAVEQEGNEGSLS